MSIAYPVRASTHFVRDTYGTTVAGAIEASAADRIAAALNYCADVADKELTEDSAGTVREDRDRLLEALRTIVNKASTRPVHVDSCDRKCALVLDSALEAGRDALQGR